MIRLVTCSIIMVREVPNMIMENIHVLKQFIRYNLFDILQSMVEKNKDYGYLRN